MTTAAELTKQNGQRMPAVTAVVLTKNEEAHIADCLKSLQWCGHVIVLDSLSTDRTVEIARRMGAGVVLRPFKNFGGQRNAALDLVNTEWVFFVDADERVCSELAEEIRTAIRLPEYDGWWVPRRNFVWGREIRHGGWHPDHQLRLLRVGSAHYDPSRPVHEIVEVDGQEGYLQAPLLHYNYRTLQEFTSKQRTYVNYEAQILHRRGVRPKAWTYLLQPLREFWRRYVVLRGYRDGWHGLLLCGLVAHYYGFVVTVKLGRLWGKEELR